MPNHTSDEHPWFIESKSSRNQSQTRLVHLARPQARRQSAQQLAQQLGGPAWKLDPATGQYYFHAFLAKQPDVNWRNHDLRQAMYDVLKFWLDRGVDGFRIDVIYHIVKDDQFRDNPRNPDYKPGQNPNHDFLAIYISDRPEVQDIITEMRHVVDQYPDRMLVGEVYLPIDRLMAYYGSGGGTGGGNGVHMPFISS